MTTVQNGAKVARPRRTHTCVTTLARGGPSPLPRARSSASRFASLGRRVIRETSGIVADIRGIGATGVRAVRARLELGDRAAGGKAQLTRSLLVAIASLAPGDLRPSLAIAFPRRVGARRAILRVRVRLPRVSGGWWRVAPVQSARRDSLL
jgi:hypothetical protein